MRDVQLKSLPGNVEHQMLLRKHPPGDSGTQHVVQEAVEEIQPLPSDGLPAALLQPGCQGVQHWRCRQARPTVINWLTAANGMMECPMA